MEFKQILILVFLAQTFKNVSSILYKTEKKYITAGRDAIKEIVKNSITIELEDGEGLDDPPSETQERADILCKQNVEETKKNDSAHGAKDMGHMTAFFYKRYHTISDSEKFREKITELQDLILFTVKLKNYQGKVLTQIGVSCLDEDAGFIRGIVNAVTFGLLRHSQLTVVLGFIGLDETRHNHITSGRDKIKEMLRDFITIQLEDGKGLDDAPSEAQKHADSLSRQRAEDENAYIDGSDQLEHMNSIFYDSTRKINNVKEFQNTIHEKRLCILRIAQESRKNGKMVDQIGIGYIWQHTLCIALHFRTKDENAKKSSTSSENPKVQVKDVLKYTVSQLTNTDGKTLTDEEWLRIEEKIATLQNIQIKNKHMELAETVVLEKLGEEIEDDHLQRIETHRRGNKEVTFRVIYKSVSISSGTTLSDVLSILGFAFRKDRKSRDSQGVKGMKLKEYTGEKINLLEDVNITGFCVRSFLVPKTDKYIFVYVFIVPGE